MVLSTEWSQVEVIDLLNDGNGLGFILVGGKSTGVVIKALTPGGVAERDGRLQGGDHVLQIGEVNLRGFSSEQVATVLRQTGAQVRIIVARPVEPTSPDYQALASHAPIIPTRLLTDPEELERQLVQTAAITGPFFSAQDAALLQQANAAAAAAAVAAATAAAAAAGTTTIANDTAQMSMLQLTESFMQQRSNSITAAALLSPCSVNAPSQLNSPGSGYGSETSMMSPETETYNVELRKNVYGLGITVAGYVCEEEDLSGIFVKSIIEGSAAEMSRKIQINDRIVAVDGRSLAGSTNHQAVEVLRNTDIAVRLTLERFLRGRKYEHLQVALTEVKEVRPSQLSTGTLAAAHLSLPPSPSCATLTWVPAKSDAASMVTIDIDENDEDNQIEAELESHTTVDSNIFGLEMNGQNDSCNQSLSTRSSASSRETTPIAESPRSLDTVVLGWGRQFPDSQIVVAELNKLAGLGISLEGTVDVEGGVEKRPHHFIRSILDDGPVATEGSLRPGDEILQVNEHRLQGLKHTDVVKILKELPQRVKMVCARGPSAPSVINTSQNAEAFESRSILPGGHLGLMMTKAQSESSLYTSSTATLTDVHRSRSVEHVSGLALWSSEVVYVDIEKVECGFGFSILDYQDPIDPDGTVIVVRGLIPGGSAESSNLLFPGDRIISVGGVRVQGGTLDEAVAVLKGMPLGMVRIGLCRPLCVSDDSSTPDTPT